MMHAQSEFSILFYKLSQSLVTVKALVLAHLGLGLRHPMLSKYNERILEAPYFILFLTELYQM